MKDRAPDCGSVPDTCNNGRPHHVSDRQISVIPVKVSSLIGTICVILMMLHVTADVIGRYFFNAPLPGTIVVVANYYMVVLVFLAIGVAEEQRAHISVEFVTDMMPERVQTGFSVFSVR